MKRFFLAWFTVGIAAHSLAGVTLIAMFLITLAEVVMRAVWRPIPGTFEIISLLGGLIVGLAIPYTSQMKGHVNVDFMVNMLPKTCRKIVIALTRLMVLIFFLIIAWSLISLGLNHLESKEVTQTLRFPLYPVFFLLGGIFIVQALQFMLDVIKVIGGDHE